MNKYHLNSYAFPPVPGVFRNIFKVKGPFSLPTWLPANIVGQQNGWPSNPLPANANTLRNSFGSRYNE